ncbi:hypothetical protein A1C_00040 [Rickettsia akari str. Hartford]|uniref:Uncharacterized protein n=1 Tax=Rickettsia akari (strain Hartford) TaxID=293614 RepID=A8GLS0_RICAH|nr:hypothetical protein A1C_00040 [Rickettsia akari str. Hartford]
MLFATTFSYDLSLIIAVNLLSAAISPSTVTVLENFHTLVLC